MVLDKRNRVAEIETTNNPSPIGEPHPNAVTRDSIFTPLFDIYSIIIS
jgi:hypothetical protein